MRICVAQDANKRNDTENDVAKNSAPLVVSMAINQLALMIRAHHSKPPCIRGLTRISQECLPVYTGFFQFTHNVHLRGNSLLRSLVEELVCIHPVPRKSVEILVCMPSSQMGRSGPMQMLPIQFRLLQLCVVDEYRFGENRLTDIRRGIAAFP